MFRAVLVLAALAFLFDPPPFLFHGDAADLAALAESVTLVDFESVTGWQIGHAAKSTISTESVDGESGRAIRVRYDVTKDHWVEIGRDMTFDWRRVDAFHFYLRGDANGSVIELKLKDVDGSYYGLKMPISGVAPDRWTKIDVPFRDCHYHWGGDTKLDTVASLWFAVSRGLARAGHIDIDEFSFSTKIPGAPSIQIEASQIGYHPWDSKSFVVRVLDASPDARPAGIFRVVTLEPRLTVFKGSLKETPYPKWSGRFLTGDFSDVRAAGNYQIEVELWDESLNRLRAVAPSAHWTAVSYPFGIDSSILGRLTAPIQYFYARFMRCGIICHKKDPVPGGYHDTQMDISKRMWSIPHFILGLARYAATGSFRFDSDTDGVDDVTNELRFGLKFITDMPEPDGTVSWGGIEADFKKYMSYDDFIARLGPLRREEDTIPRVKYLDKSLGGTCFNTVALLEGADAVRPVDPALADRAVSVAKKAWTWIDAQPLSAAHEYGVYLYAASALNRRFPDGGYLHRLGAIIPALLDLQSLNPAVTENGAVGNFFYSAAEHDFHFQYKFVSFNIAIHLALIQLEQDLPRSYPLWNRIHYANTVFARSYLPAMSSLTPYRQMAHGLEPGPDGVFHPKQFAGKAGERAAASFHGLNCDHFGYAYVAEKIAQMTGDVSLERFADEQIQWALGKNPLGYCMMAGAGSHNPVHMSAYFGKGPILGEIPNGIVSGDEQNEEPQWWGDGPSSGEDWLPHNSYYLSLISELDRPAAVRVTARRGGVPVAGLVQIARSDGLKLPDVPLKDGSAGPIELVPQAPYVLRIFAKAPDGAETPAYARGIEAVSGQTVMVNVDLNRDLTFEWKIPEGAGKIQDVPLTLTCANRSPRSIEFHPVLSVIGGTLVTPFPERIAIPGQGTANQRVTIHPSGARPVLVRMEDRDDSSVTAEAYWVASAPSSIVPANIIDDFSSLTGWSTENDQGASAAAKADGGALRIDYTFGGGKWVQAKKSLSPDLRPYNALAFRMRGEGPANRLEIKLEDKDGVNFGKSFDAATAGKDWRDYEIPFKEFKYWWGGDGSFDWQHPKLIYIAAAKSGGGQGSIWIDDLKFEKLEDQAPEVTPPQKAYEYVTGDEAVAKKAAKWISWMQQKSGLILSYEGDNRPFAWTYDQGLCLIVLAHEDRPAAVRLLDALRKLQKPEGYWNDGVMLDTGGGKFDLSKEDQAKWFRSTVPGVMYEFDNRWIGSVAWVVHGIQRYVEITGDRRYADMADSGAGWLASQQRADGSLHDVTEGNMTSWRALKAAGLMVAADKVKTYLLTKIWNDEEGRYRVAPTNPQVYLDVQTWGASFSVAAGFPENGLRSLAFAKTHLECKSPPGRPRGFDATGPYAVWNEGTLQYIVAGGAGAAEYLKDMNAQQRKDGALQHSHENLSQGGAWHTSMYGVCPTAWLYFANMGNEPFPRKGD